MTAGGDPVYQLALRDVHAAAGASFERSGMWMLPAHYGSPEGEHATIRERAAVFDRSNRSRFMVTGTDAMNVLQVAFAGHVEELEEGRAMRVVSLDGEGRITDLALIARTGGISYLVIGEPGQRFVTLNRLNAGVELDWDAAVSDRTETTCLIGIAGPHAAESAREYLSELLPARLQMLHSVAFEFHGFRALALRTSDTGEDGFELVLAPAVAQHVLETFQGAGVALAGYEAQEVARIEACVPAFDPDLEPGLTPAEADLDVLLGMQGGHAHRLLSALLLEGEPVPPGTALMGDGEEVAGEIRSCVRSGMLNATIALGIIDGRHALPGRALRTAKGVGAHVVTKPFLRRRAAP